MGAIVIRNTQHQDRPFFDWYTDYSENFSGMSRTLSVINKSAKVGKELGSSPLIKELHQESGVALGTLGVIQIPGATRDAYRSFQALSQEDGGTFFKRVLTACKNMMGALKCWASASYLFTANPTFKLMEKVGGLGKEVSDLSMIASNYSQVSELSDYAIGHVKEAADYSRNYYFLSLIKNVTAIVSSILTVVALVFNFTLLPALFAATISLVSTMLAIQTDYIKETGKYKVVSFG